MISFVVDIISWKYKACSWLVEIYPDISPIYQFPGPNSTNFRRADRMDFSPLVKRTMVEGSNLLIKWGKITCQELSARNPRSYVKTLINLHSLVMVRLFLLIDLKEIPFPRFINVAPVLSKPLIIEVKYP